ncbi:hypothetical protein ACLOJK_024319 [Asimina triloba]
MARRLRHYCSFTSLLPSSQTEFSLHLSASPRDYRGLPVFGVRSEVGCQRRDQILLDLEHANGGKTGMLRCGSCWPWSDRWQFGRDGWKMVLLARGIVGHGDVSPSRSGCSSAEGAGGSDDWLSPPDAGSATGSIAVRWRDGGAVMGVTALAGVSDLGSLAVAVSPASSDGGGDVVIYWPDGFVGAAGWRRWRTEVVLVKGERMALLARAKGLADAG